MSDPNNTEHLYNQGDYYDRKQFFPYHRKDFHGPEEASRCAALIGAKHTIPIHMKPDKLFDRSAAEALHASGRVIAAPGETIDLYGDGISMLNNSRTPQM